MKVLKACKQSRMYRRMESTLTTKLLFPASLSSQVNAVFVTPFGDCGRTGRIREAPKIIYQLTVSLVKRSPHKDIQ